MQRKVVPGNGCPAGKAIAWAWAYGGGNSTRMIYGVVEYDSLQEALKDVGPLMLDVQGINNECKGIIVNYKLLDESEMWVYELKCIAKWPKREPYDWSKSILNPKNWLNWPIKTNEESKI